MSHAENKVEWCLNQAKKHIVEGRKHRGLVQVKPDERLAREHIAKAEHYLLATAYLKKGNFSDISASTVFYSMYHCLLAIAAKFGYESRNQDCTFALIHSLAEGGKVSLEKGLLDKLAKETIARTKVILRE